MLRTQKQRGRFNWKSFDSTHTWTFICYILGKRDNEKCQFIANQVHLLELRRDKIFIPINISNANNQKSC